MQQLEFHAMGCEIKALLDRDDPLSSAALQRVPMWFYEWEQRFSRFLSESELSQVNRSSGVPTEVSPLFWEILQLALQAHQTSQGLVRPTMLPALLAAGYQDSFDSLEKDQPPIPGVGFPAIDPAAIELDPSARSIRLPEGMQLDFGGIAKGWAAQQAMLRLSEYGPALVDAGGDIAVGEACWDDQPWEIGIADPFVEGQNLETFLVAEVGVATSGTTHRRWLQGGKPQHHIIDPRTNRPAVTDVVSATVFAPSLVDAETGAKTVLILGSRQGMAWIETQAEMNAVVVLDSAEMLFDTTLQTIGTSYAI